MNRIIAIIPLILIQSSSLFSHQKKQLFYFIFEFIFTIYDNSHISKEFRVWFPITASNITIWIFLSIKLEFMKMHFFYLFIRNQKGKLFFIINQKYLYPNFIYYNIQHVPLISSPHHKPSLCAIFFSPFH